MLLNDVTDRKLAAAHTSIQQITLTKGKEKYHIRPFSLMWILLNLGIKMKIARYFPGRKNWYSIEDTYVLIETDSFEIELFNSGYVFDSVKKNFTNLNLGERLKIIQ